MKSRLLFLLMAFCFLNFSCKKSSDNKPSEATLPEANSFNEKLGCYDENSFKGIMGGSRVTPNDPDSRKVIMLLIVKKTLNEDGDNNTGICTASALTDRVLITAAHCLDDAEKVIAVFHTDLFCQSGFRISTMTTLARSFSSHPLYTDLQLLLPRERFKNPDIGLVLLDQKIPAIYSKFKINTYPETLNSDLKLMGYGTTSYDANDSARLRKTNVRKSNVEFIDESIVVSNNGVNGTCTGDSGGPVLVENQGQLEIAAVVSFGFNSDASSESQICHGKGSSIMVYPYLDWIEREMNSWGQSIN